MTMKINIIKAIPAINKIPLSIFLVSLFGKKKIKAEDKKPKKHAANQV
jgi:hypothetical protein